MGKLYLVDGVGLWSEVINNTDNFTNKAAIFIDRDGMKGIADTNLLIEIRKQTNIQILYGGGVSSFEDIKKIYDIGFNGICMSRALHFNELHLRDLKKKMNRTN